ncbi:hydroxyacylglutathione hydrolase [Ferrovibrio sp.]|uniref:hydroxyacylglutathione hydrolase n=1 Tax=Ferrovibrio sp. TaxID=1917215 RepID=UPI0035B395CD
MPLEIVQIPVLSDNYIYLLHDPAENRTAVVDPAVHEPVLAELQRRGWRLDHIFNTHHHPDHVGGNRALMDATSCDVIGPRNEAARIPGLRRAVGDGDSVALGGAVAQVFDVPGHTAGHIAYWFAQDAALFCGDTLFSLGCGRLFEGTAAQMWASLSKLAALPGETRIYCAHEYTESNARFALSLEPGNAALQQRWQDIQALRGAGKPTVPSRLDQERACNPFLRPMSAEIRASLSAAGIAAGADDTAVFAAARKAKDSFKG